MKISFVVLCYNGWEYTHQLLMDIKNYCSNVHEVVVVDNGSEDTAVRSGLEMWMQMKVLPMKVTHLAVNRGFPGGMNYGIKHATGDIIAVLSNDIKIVSCGLLEEIEKVFTDNEKVILGQSLYTHDTGWNNFDVIGVIPYVEGYFLASTKNFWKQVGGFDEVYGVSDYEDVDLSFTAVQAGYKLMQFDTSFIKHLGGKTLGYADNRQQRTHQNRLVFKDKWRLK